MTISPSDLAARAEAFLFSEGGPITRSKLASLLGCEEKELAPILDILASRLTGGITLMQSDREVALAVSKIDAQYVKEARARELDRDIGDAGLEVLSIVLYRGPSTRGEIDYIRGVNTSSTIRTLLARGLIERSGGSQDGREYVYRPTIELLAHVGVHSAESLPDYATIRSELDAFEARRSSAEHDPNA